MSDDLKRELTDLATAIVKQANAQGEGAPSFEQKVDAIDKLTKLYIAFRRHPGEETPDEDGFDFGKGIQPASQEQPNGATRVQPRRRPSTHS